MNFLQTCWQPTNPLYMLDFFGLPDDVILILPKYTFEFIPGYDDAEIISILSLCSKRLNRLFKRKIRQMETIVAPSSLDVSFGQLWKRAYAAGITPYQQYLKESCENNVVIELFLNKTYKFKLTFYITLKNLPNHPENWEFIKYLMRHSKMNKHRCSITTNTMYHYLIGITGKTELIDFFDPEHAHKRIITGLFIGGHKSLIPMYHNTMKNLDEGFLLPYVKFCKYGFEEYMEIVSPCKKWITGTIESFFSLYILTPFDYISYREELNPFLYNLEMQTNPDLLFRELKTPLLASAHSFSIFKLLIREHYGRAAKIVWKYYKHNITFPDCKRLEAYAKRQKNYCVMNLIKNDNNYEIRPSNLSILLNIAVFFGFLLIWKFAKN